MYTFGWVYSAGGEVSSPHSELGILKLEERRDSQAGLDLEWKIWTGSFKGDVRKTIASGCTSTCTCLH